jgi:hypothetical protein
MEFCTGLKGLFEHSLSIAIAAVVPRISPSEYTLPLGWSLRACSTA